ncbi:MAG: thioredoxin domain-containing protein [Candidatus Woesearchaeota archaeon]|jgi:protein-disulfide isomerase
MENNKKQGLNTPTAIVAAGVLIMLAILITNGGSKTNSDSNKEKTLSEQVGVNKDKFTQCMKDTDLQVLRTNTGLVADNAMKGVPADQRGTPYSVVIGKNGVKTEIRGAYPKEDIKKLIDEVTAGKVTTPYTGETTGYQEGDHILGNPDAPIVVVEYSDLECPYCKKFSASMKEIVSESNGNVAWIYRHWVVHQGALPKAGAAECVAKLKGNEAFWKYIDLVFGLMKTEEDTTSTANL